MANIARLKVGQAVMAAENVVAKHTTIFTVNQGGMGH